MIGFCPAAVFGIAEQAADVHLGQRPADAGDRRAVNRFVLAEQRPLLVRQCEPEGARGGESQREYIGDVDGLAGERADIEAQHLGDLAVAFGEDVPHPGQAEPDHVFGEFGQRGIDLLVREHPGDRRPRRRGQVGRMRGQRQRLVFEDQIGADLAPYIPFGIAVGGREPAQLRLVVPEFIPRFLLEIVHQGGKPRGLPVAVEPQHPVEFRQAEQFQQPQKLAEHAVVVEHVDDQVQASAVEVLVKGQGVVADADLLDLDGGDFVPQAFVAAIAARQHPVCRLHVPFADTLGAGEVGPRQQHQLEQVDVGEFGFDDGANRIEMPFPCIAGQRQDDFRIAVGADFAGAQGQLDDFRGADVIAFDVFQDLGIQALDRTGQAHRAVHQFGRFEDAMFVVLAGGDVDVVGKAVFRLYGADGAAGIQVFLVHAEVRIGDEHVAATADFGANAGHVACDVFKLVANPVGPPRLGHAGVVRDALDAERAAERTPAVGLDQRQQLAVEEGVQRAVEVRRRDFGQIRDSRGGGRGDKAAVRQDPRHRRQIFGHVAGNIVGGDQRPHQAGERDLPFLGDREVDHRQGADHRFLLGDGGWQVRSAENHDDSGMVALDRRRERSRKVQVPDIVREADHVGRTVRRQRLGQRLGVLEQADLRRRGDMGAGIGADRRDRHRHHVGGDGLLGIGQVAEPDAGGGRHAP